MDKNNFNSIDNIIIKRRKIFISKKAFTLVELLGVLVILGILISIATISYTRYQRSAKEKAVEIAINSLKDSANNFFVNCNTNFNGKNKELCNRYPIPEEVDGTTKVWLTDLQSESLIEPVENPYKPGQKCDVEKSYIKVTNKNSSGKNIKLDYQVCLVCGNDYVNDNSECDYIHTAPTEDKNNPIFNSEVEVSSKESNYNSLNVIVKVDAIDNESGLKDMCISQSGFGDCAKWVPYDYENEIKLNGNYDGVERRIYVTVRDEAGNYMDKSGLYTPYKKPTITTQIASSSIGTRSFDVSVGVTASDKGLEKVVWYYKRSNETSYSLNAIKTLSPKTLIL